MHTVTKYYKTTLHEGLQSIWLWLQRRTTLADLPPDKFDKLAECLKEFSPDYPSKKNPFQYWEIIAEELRNDLPNEFDGYDDVVSLI